MGRRVGRLAERDRGFRYLQIREEDGARQHDRLRRMPASPPKQGGGRLLKMWRMTIRDKGKHITVFIIQGSLAACDAVPEPAFARKPAGALRPGGFDRVQQLCGAASYPALWGFPLTGEENRGHRQGGVPLRGRKQALTDQAHGGVQQEPAIGTKGILQRKGLSGFQVLGCAI